MMKITVKTHGKTYCIESAEPILLAEAVRALGIPYALPCAGTGRCGKCKVKASGDISPPNAMEEAHLTEAELCGGIRLLCRTVAVGDTVVDLMQDGAPLRGITEGRFPQSFRVTAPFDEGVGLAFDIGTTTVAGYAYEFPGGRCIASLSRENRQRTHGADVISRIAFAVKGGAELLKQEITAEIAEMEKELAGGREVKARVITGNTAMLSFYRGVDTLGLSRAPFQAASLFGMWEGNTYFPRAMDAFVGADVTAAILAADLLRHQTALLLDIGTNGEMALWHAGRLTCCSAAAGPAFEGVGISQGTEAVPGAVSGVRLASGNLRYETIGNASPIGICGTGVIDAVAALLERGDADASGYMEKSIEIAPGVRFTPEDVRQVQLAKAAIAAGIRVLLEDAGITASDPEVCYLAGGFGSLIRPESAVRIGLLPKEIAPTPIGNGAGMGASMLLLDPTRIPDAEDAAKRARTLNLAESPLFGDYFMEEMAFPRR